jgi:hypothetical protein
MAIDAIDGNSGAWQIGRDRSAYGTDVYADQRNNQLFDLPLVLEEKDE